MALDLNALRKTAAQQKTLLNSSQKPQSAHAAGPKSDQKAPARPDVRPHSDDAEKGVLSSMLQDPPNAIPEAQRGCQPWFFYNPVHHALFSTLCDHWDSGEAVDLITFTQFLRDKGQLEKVGGAGYVTELFTFVPSPVMLSHYIGIVREKALRREMIAAGTALARTAFVEGEDLSALLQKSNRTLSRIIEFNESKTLQDAHYCLNGHRPEMPDELVRHILHRGSKMVVGGTSKGRKTMALIDLAVSIATGTEWWGFHTKQGPVCYINFEIQDAFFWYRVDEVCRSKGVSLPAGSLYAWNLRGKANAMEGMTDEIISILKSKPFVLDVIDPIYKALGDRDENKAGDVASMLNELEKIAVETDAAIAFGAHYSKGNQALKEHIDRIGGSGVFTRDPDSILTMTSHEEDDCFTVESTLRNFPPNRPFVVRWEWPLFVREGDLDPNSLKKSNDGRFEVKYEPDMILDQMSVIHGLTVKQIRSELGEANGISKATFYRLWDYLKRNDKIALDSDNKWIKKSDS